MTKCKSLTHHPRRAARECTAPELAKIVKQLVELKQALPALSHVSLLPPPSLDEARELIKLARLLLFPGFFSPRPVTELNFEYHTGQILYCFYELLGRAVTAALRHDCRRYHLACLNCEDEGRRIALEVTRGLPGLREILATDVDAALNGDPAAGAHYDQIIFCYPGLYAITVQRLAHELYLRQVPFLPRIMTEYAHARTGIDIHPGAEIGPSFFIDHGTGVVIGETCRIGRRVKLYQGVTLGALSFAKDETGALVKGVKRHPDVEDNVVIYAGATILGGDTVIGRDSVIGGNVWLIHSVPPGSKVYNSTPAPTIQIKN